MADSTIASTNVILRDNWPSQYLPRPLPQDFLTSGLSTACGQNVTTPMFPVGTKLVIANSGTTGQPGHGTMIYLKFTDAVTARALVVPTSGGSSLFEVTALKASKLAYDLGLMAVAAGTVAAASYGWAWCGGVPPVEKIGTLSGTLVTDSYVEAVKAVIPGDAAGTNIALTVLTASLTGNAQTLTFGYLPAGLALAADA